MRGESTQGSSLDLLLDTICNTFGGVLFLAMLVCVLLQNTRPTTTPDNKAPSEQDISELRRVHAELQSQMESLQAGAAQQRDIIAQFAVPEKVQVLTEYKDVANQRDILASERTKQIGQVDSLHSRIKQINKDLQQLDQQIPLAEKELSIAEGDLLAEIDARTQQGKLPRLHQTTKTEVGVIVRYGKIYIWHKYGLNNQRLGLNTDDFVILDESTTSIEVSPKPYRGLTVASDERFASGVQALLGRFNPNRYCIAGVVWPDSFEQFQHLKKVLIGMGFEYRLMPMPKGESVVDQGGSGGYVQ